MLACTDPAIGTVDEIILTREPEQSPGQPASYQDSSDNYDITISDTIDPRLLFLSFIGPSFSMDLDRNDTDGEYLPGSTLGRPDPGNSDEELRARVSLLQVGLRQVATVDSHIQSFLATESSAAFFTVSNFRECIEVFFQREQLLATIIHKPTFRPDQADPSLLLAIAVSGSAYIHYRQGNNAGPASFVLTLREIAEKYIFHRVEQLLGSTTSADAQQSLELCQAAYIIETLQSCVKNAKIRQRLITKCHPMLVDLLRDLDIIRTRHEPDQDWTMFVRKESRIRLAHWAFINDGWFTLFSNHPPAMTFFDMTGHLPCRDELWNADRAASFESLRSQEDFSSSLPCPKFLISALLGDEWTEGTVALFQHLDIKHFLVIIFGEFSVLSCSIKK